MALPKRELFVVSSFEWTIEAIWRVQQLVFEDVAPPDRPNKPLSSWGFRQFLIETVRPKALQAGALVTEAEARWKEYGVPLESNLLEPPSRVALEVLGPDGQTLARAIGNGEVYLDGQLIQQASPDFTRRAKP
jgi:hypothetical protein